jgi:hypothetical protein
VKKRSPLIVCQCATSGLRELFHATFVGSMRPGLNVSPGAPDAFATTLVASSAPPAVPGTSEILDGLYLQRSFRQARK